jgi:D-alanyl-lipoteichoic acid acyltransferase DltB (MBOAT superfamily)
MLFNSLDFAIFLPIVFVLYWFVFNRSLKLQNLLLVVASFIFYGWWDWRFLSLIVFSSVLDFVVGIQLEKTENQKIRKRLLYTSIIINLGMLGFFKYFNFFLDSFVEGFKLLGQDFQIERLNILLPMGISFYTFQTLSYTIDIYRKELKPTNNFIQFLGFVTFFPQLVAGPIERAKNLLPQFYVLRKFSNQKAHEGILDITWGLFKKIVIADGLSQYIDIVYGDITSFSGFPIIWATLFFTFQIYCDFSGYSSIAIGTAKLFGFELVMNFRRPHFAKSLQEFWSRWHMSFSTWLKDYVYIPLGGNRSSKFRTNLNLFLTFLISGLWHGANWTFVFWGGIHGIMYVINKMSFFKNRKSIISVVVVFLLVCFSRVFFRANTISDAFYGFSHLLPTSFSGLIGIPTITKSSFIFYFVIIIILFTIEYFLEKRYNATKSYIYPKRNFTILYSSLLIVFIYVLGTFENQEFIYFQF